MASFPIFTGKEQEEMVILIEPRHCEVEVSVSHTINRRVCMTGIWCIVSVSIVFGMIGAVILVIATKNH